MSEQVQMDALAYGSRMVGWAPLGKLFFIFSLLIVGLISNSVVVPIVTFCIGVVMMFYSTNMKIPFLIGLAIGEAILIMIIGCGMISIMGSEGDPMIWEGNILWIQAHMTSVSFNNAWLFFFKAIGGVTLMLAFATSTPIPHLAHAFSKLRVPVEIIEIIVLLYRYSFLLLERMEIMWNAAKCRLGFNGLMRSVRTSAGILVGMFIVSLEMTEKSQSALECRNYRGYFPILNMPKEISFVWVVISIGLVLLLYALGTYTKDWIDFASLLLGA